MRRGQASVELILALMLLAIPSIVGAGHWMKREWEKSKCAFQSIQEARAKVIFTKLSAHVTQTCGGVREEVTFLPLEDLDWDKGPLGMGDWANEVSQFGELFSSWQSSLSARDSSMSDSQSKIGPNDKHSLIEIPAPPPSPSGLR